MKGCRFGLFQTPLLTDFWLDLLNSTTSRGLPPGLWPPHTAYPASFAQSVLFLHGSFTIFIAINALTALCRVQEEIGFRRRTDTFSGDQQERKKIWQTVHQARSLSNSLPIECEAMRGCRPRSARRYFLVTAAQKAFRPKTPAP